MKVIRRIVFIVGVCLSVELISWLFFNALGLVMFQTRYIGVGRFMPTPAMMVSGPILLLLTWRKTRPEIQEFIDKHF